MAVTIFGPRRHSVSGKPVTLKPKEQRVNSYMFLDAELQHATVEGVSEIKGSAALHPSRPGDVARSFFGVVVRCG